MQLIEAADENRCITLSIAVIMSKRHTWLWNKSRALGWE